MTPQKLADLHIINQLELDDDETIDYHQIPNYKTACENEGFYIIYDENTKKYCVQWDIPIDNKNYIPGDNNYESKSGYYTEEKAWIICAEENAIDPYDHFVVSNWLYDRLSIKGESVSNYKGCLIWGRTHCLQSCHLDTVIQKIAQERTERHIKDFPHLYQSKSH